MPWKPGAQKVDYAIHPVAGRMPGHTRMCCLQEANVDYEHMLRNGQKVNPMFKGCRIWPSSSARERRGQPGGQHGRRHADLTHAHSYDVDNAKNFVYICNFDEKPSYAGV